MRAVISGRVKGGKFNNLTALIRELAKFDSREVKITIEKKQTRWTNQQRKYLFGYVYPFVGELLDITDKQARDGLRNMYLFERRAIFKVLRSESDLSIEEYGEYVDRIDIFCVDNFGVNLEEPKK